MRLGGRRVEGLSPLARGNQILRHCWTLWLGPIPARAGQPRPCRIRRPWCWAYPRSRGATFASVGGMDKMKGLSPLARGNQGRCMGRPAYQGPIPARAGQPPDQTAQGLLIWAYPRSRGATVPAHGQSLQCGGLSPLARGNRHAGPGGYRPDRPIPARAGQPLCRMKQTSLIRAYPRSRGATVSASQLPKSTAGLSPLARGNRLSRHRNDFVSGPIPARAGQPPDGVLL